MPSFFNKQDKSVSNVDVQVNIKKDIYKPKFSNNDAPGVLITNKQPEGGEIASTTTTTTRRQITTSTTSTTTTVFVTGQFTLQNLSSHSITALYDGGTTGNPNSSLTVIHNLLLIY